MLRGLLDGESLREDAETALRALVGRENARLRDDQWRAIEALVAFRRRALVVQRTGWGKSAVYFVATRLLRDRGAGPTVIVSPLLALMRDQVAAAARAGIRAVTINSSNVTEWDEVHAAIAAGEVDVLLCSPERLNNPGFRDEVLPRLAADAGLVVVDEAHCISDWGHDFRPDYRRIRTLLADLPAGIPVLATTATANARVTADVAEQLGVRAQAVTGTGTASNDEVLVLRGGLDRESLHLAVLPLPDQPSRVAWLVEALQDVDGSGIVYCLTVSAAEQVASQLRAAGLAVAAYTGQTDPAERERLEEDLKENRVKALVATSALGMGFDKPDLAFVVHLGAPSSPIAYYQQVGRAGRGVDSAVVVLLPGEEDRRIWEWFASTAFPPQAQVRATLAALDGGGTQSVAQLETQVDLKRSRLEGMLKVLDVDGAVRRVKGGWEATGQAWEYDAERYARVEQTRAAEQRAMLDYEATTGCRMAFLRATLDDPELEPGWECGRCDRCGGVTLPAVPDADAVAAARADMDRPGVEVVARRQWPSGMDRLGVEVRGRIPADEQAEPGRAVARLDGLGWSGPLRELFSPGAPDGETPVALRRAAARVLDEWTDLYDVPEGGDTAQEVQGPGTAVPERRLLVDGVVAVRSVTRPQLTFHLANGLASYLGRPLVGAIGPVPGREEPGRHDVNSATRLAGVTGRLRLELSDAARAGLAGRRLLLVDDWTESGWTITVAARLLRLAGAEAVHPFVLGVR
ncbi:RecQ family ATP-dependent DNA helicase [Cellulosimicrobium marinum]|uniref:RecQ family ATP-dependent DNA helicase n=1 Tax=Cellulosimicrobium marinum TaxID=1638992 RepID=UPI001E358DDF|nr:RecQ family ATP-dependent DNA helicase [Cellulosimicrobium marinum]MCB7137802.1 RecQ family ATP-dependent DNA helicase [Cellulosimicrobium marinum]